MTQNRWLVRVAYSTDNGPVLVDHEIEELEDLQDIIERGPDWNSLIGIAIVLNPERRNAWVTVEEARNL